MLSLWPRPAGFGLAPREVRARTPGKPLLPTNLKFFDGQTLAIREGRDILFETGRISALPAMAPWTSIVSTAVAAT